MGEDTRGKGMRGEDAAVSYLQSEGYQIIARNFRYRGGEIDIVARDGETLVFVEVKTRRTRDPILPLLGVTRRKRLKIARAAGFFLKSLDAGRMISNAPDCRFDVVAVLLNQQGAVAGHELIKGAFWGEVT